MKIDTQDLETMTVRGVRAAYAICFRDGVSFEDHFAELGGSPSAVLAAAEELCQMVYDGQVPDPLGEVSAKDHDAIIAALRTVIAAQALLSEAGAYRA